MRSCHSARSLALKPPPTRPTYFSPLPDFTPTSSDENVPVPRPGHEGRAAHHEFLLAMAFDLEPVRRAVADVGRIDLLGDQSFEMLIADARQQLGAVAVDLVGEPQQTLGR